MIRNQFGGTFGGPVLHDKAFFFADYEGLREIDRVFTTASIPSAQQRAGIFTNGSIPIPIQNPLTGKIYADGVIPQSDFSPLAAAVFAALPAENAASTPGTATGNNYLSLPRATTRITRVMSVSTTRPRRGWYFLAATASTVPIFSCLETFRVRLAEITTGMF